MNVDKPELPAAFTLRDVLSGHYDTAKFDHMFKAFAKSIVVSPVSEHLAKLSLAFPTVEAMPKGWPGAKVQVLPKGWPHVTGLETGWAAKAATFNVAAARCFDTQRWTSISKVLAEQSTIGPKPGLELLVLAAASALATSCATVTATVAPPSARIVLTPKQALVFAGLSADLLQIASYMQDATQQRTLVLMSIVLFSAAVVYGLAKLEE
jgi:hypothetical protein